MTGPPLTSPGRPGSSVQAATASTGLGHLDAEAIYRRYQAQVARFAHRRGAEDPEGVADVALFKAIAAIPELRDQGEHSFRAYLFRTALNEIRGEGRRFRPMPVEPGEIDNASDLDGGFETGAIDRLWLDELMATLPPDQRDTIEDRYLLGLTAEQSGRKRGRNANAVYQLQHRALKKLRRAAFVACAAAVVVGGLLVWHHLTRGGFDLDHTPATRPDLTTVPTGPVDPVPTTDRSEDGDARTERLSTPATTEADEAPGDPPSPTSTSVETSLPAETTDGAPAESPTTTSQTTSSSTSTLAAAPPDPTPLNACQSHQLTATVAALKLFDPGGSRAVALDFVAPTAIRFLGPDGVESYRVTLEANAMRGTAPGAYGWIGAGDGSGTYPTYDQAAPLPVRWGILFDDGTVGGAWSAVEWRDSSGSWTAVPGCRAGIRGGD